MRCSSITPKCMVVLKISCSTDHWAIIFRHRLLLFMFNCRWLSFNSFITWTSIPTGRRWLSSDNHVMTKVAGIEWHWCRNQIVCFCHQELSIGPGLFQGWEAWLLQIYTILSISRLVEWLKGKLIGKEPWRYYRRYPNERTIAYL